MLEKTTILIKILVSFCLGVLLGLVAGLVGVGGGEFRIPILLYVLKLPIMASIAVNLFIGLLTVTVSFLRRFQLGLLDTYGLSVAMAMIPASIFGAYIGATLTGRISEKPLKKLLAILLTVVGLKIASEPFTYGISISYLKMEFIETIGLAVLTGLAVGIVCGFLGVAGGEFRIPILMYIFNLDIVVAGTVSLLVSIPTVASGFFKHHTMGHMDRDAILIAIVMGLGSVLGAFTGASYVEVVDRDIIKIILGMVLILATIRMLTKP